MVVRDIAGAAATADGVKAMLSRPIQLAEQLAKAAEAAAPLRPECANLSERARTLADLLRQTARSDTLYERPAARILSDAAQALSRALALALNCRSNSLFHRLFAIVPSAAITRAANALDSSIQDITWYLSIATPSTGSDDDDGDLHGLPNIAQSEPILFLIWVPVASLHTGSPAVRADAAASLATLARGSQHYAKCIIEEDGIPPLLKLLKEGSVDDGREAAARAVGYLAGDADSVERLVQAGACAALTAALMNPPMRVQAEAAWAIGQLADHEPSCQDLFAQTAAVRLLVGHIAFETIQDHQRYAVQPAINKSLHSVVLASIHEAPAPAMSGGYGLPPKLKHFDSQLVHSAMVARGARPRETEDPETKAKMKAMAAYALWKLCTGNLNVCRSVTELRALLSIAALLEKSPSREVKYYSAVALLEITRAAEQSQGLRQSAFNPTSLPARAVVEQLLKVVERAGGQQEEEEEEEEADKLLVACVAALGCLARTFTTREERIVPRLAKLLEDERHPAVAREAVVALGKFASKDNYLHGMHCRAMVAADAARHVVHLAYLGEEAQVDAVALLCHLALSVPESAEMGQAGVPALLKWAASQAHIAGDPRVEDLLPEARAKLELFQSARPAR